MQSLLSWWQHIPLHLSPVAIEFLSVPVYWYALFFLIGSALVYILAEPSYRKTALLTKVQYQDFAFGIFMSAVIGGKLGFMLLYWWPFVSWQGGVPLPSLSGSSVALPGMSFFGGLLAVTLFLLWYAKRHQKNFFALTDALALWLPVAIFFGRLGNFVHGELWGRFTKHAWGMYFPAETILRHPSSLYAAFLEGIVLFGILFFLRKKDSSATAGKMTAYFCIFYGTLRFFGEFFREPDSQIGYLGSLTLNQIFALLFVAVGVFLLSIKSRKSEV